MQTEILYYDDINLLEFEAEIIEVTQEKNNYHVILNRTAFYPDSGGMSCDIGYLNEFKVISVIKKGDEIVHVLEQEPTAAKVHGQIDAYTRLTNIQNHDAQHLLTALFEKEYDLKTVSHHVHTNYCDLVLEGPIDLTIEIMEKIEKIANDLIIAQRKMDIFYLPKSELANHGLKNNPKYTDPVRITNIEGINDYNACGCLHFDNISKIQAIKCLDIEKTGKQNKIIFTAGLRMLDYFGNLYNVFNELKVLNKANETNIVSKTQTLLDKNSDLNRELNEVKTKLYALEFERLVSEASDDFIIYQQPENNFDDLKILSNLIINYEKPIKGLLQVKKDDKFQFILVKQKEVAYSLEELFKRLKEHFHVNGGGRGLTVNGQSDIDLTSEIIKYL